MLSFSRLFLCIKNLLLFCGKAGERPDLEEEYKTLLQAAKAQEQCYRDDIDYMASSVEKLLAAMEGCVQKQ